MTAYAHLVCDYAAGAWHVELRATYAGWVSRPWRPTPREAHLTPAEYLHAVAAVCGAEAVEPDRPSVPGRCRWCGGATSTLITRRVVDRCGMCAEDGTRLEWAWTERSGWALLPAAVAVAS